MQREFTIQRASLRTLLITVGLLLIAFGVLAAGIDQMHMRPDEELTFRNMAAGFADSMIELATGNNQAPLWWMQVWAWQRYAGMSEFAGRVNSLLISMLTLSVVYQLGRVWFGAQRYGWFAIGILSVNAYFFIYALEMRMYALMLLVASLGMFALHRWLQQRTMRSALLYGLSAALLLYTHYYLAFVVLAQAAYFALRHLLNVRLIRQGIAAAAVAALTWLPGALILYGQLQLIDFADAGGLKIPTRPTNLDTILNLADLASNGLLIVYLVLIAIALWRLWRRAGLWIALAWLLISPALVFILNLWLTVYNVRYTSFLIPAIGLTVGVGIAALGNNKRAGIALRWLLLIVVMTVSLWRLPDYIPVRIPFRHLFTEVSEQYQAGDVLLIQHQIPNSYMDDQMRRYLPPTLFAAYYTDIDAASEARRIWYITDMLLREEGQQFFKEIEATHRVQNVIGDCKPAWCYVIQLMEAPPLREPLFFGERIGYLGADIQALDDNTLTTWLWWTVAEVQEQDYSFSLRLVADDGTLIAQKDGQIDPPGADFGEIPTSQLQIGGNYLDERVLTLPPDLAHGTYQLEIVVYQWWDQERLTLPDGSDHYTITTLTVDESGYAVQSP